MTISGKFSQNEFRWIKKNKVIKDEIITIIKSKKKIIVGRS